MRVQRYDFSANLQRNGKDFLRKTRKKSVKRTIITERRGNTPYYIIYIGGVSGFGFQVSSLLFSYAHQAKASQASSIPREKRKQLSGFICFTQRTQRAQSFLHNIPRLRWRSRKLRYDKRAQRSNEKRSTYACRDIRQGRVGGGR